VKGDIEWQWFCVIYLEGSNTYVLTITYDAVTPFSYT